METEKLADFGDAVGVVREHAAQKRLTLFTGKSRRLRKDFGSTWPLDLQREHASQRTRYTSMTHARDNSKLFKTDQFPIMPQSRSWQSGKVPDVSSEGPDGKRD